MRKLVLVTLFLLNGCAFDDMMSGINGTLKSTNNVLSGTLDSNTEFNNKNLKQSNKKINCEKDIEKSEKWYKSDRKKIYSSNPQQHLIIYSKKEQEVINMQGDLAYYCGYVNRDLDNPNKQYIDKIRLEEAQQKINGSKK